MINSGLPVREETDEQSFVSPVRLKVLFLDKSEVFKLPEDEENVAPVGSADARKLRG
jgi:hypothetical protein